MEFVQDANQWLLLAVLLIILLLAEEGGFRVGRRRRSGYDDDGRSNYGNLLAGLYGLMGLLLAFTFAMAQQRYESRKELVVAEANAIGTAWLRADFLAAPARDELKALLARYVEVRTPRDLADAARLGAIITESERLQNEIWSRTVAAAAPSPLGALLVAAVNDVIDAHGKRVAAWRNHVPPIVLLLVFSFALAAALVTGYRCGIGPRRYRLPSAAFLVLVALVIGVIIDLDHPQRGLITVDQRPLTDLRAAIGRP